MFSLRYVSSLGNIQNFPKVFQKKGQKKLVMVETFIFTNGSKSRFTKKN